MIKFTIPYPTGKAKAQFCKQYGLNSIYAGKHWSKRAEDAEYWKWLVRYEMQRQGVPRKLFDEPVGILMAFEDGLDCSNHAYMGKMIEDAMVGYILHNDNRKHVKLITYGFTENDEITVVVVPWDKLVTIWRTVLDDLPNI